MGITVFVEPLVITIILVVGLFANRGRPPPSHLLPLELPLFESRPTRMYGVPIPDTRPFRRRRLSRLLARYPFALEILYCAVAYAPARLIAYMLHPTGPQRRAVANALSQAHAARLLAFEKDLSLAVELRLQRYVLRCRPLLMTLLAAAYRAQTAFVVACLAYGFACFPRARYAVVRRAVLLAPLLAGALGALWPCALPRGMPAPRGFIDVLQLGREAAGLHVGVATALLLGGCVAVWGRHRGLRALALGYPLVAAAASIVVADEWVLGYAGGACVVAVGLGCNRVLLLLRSFEEWGFWVCRAARPRDREGEEQGVRDGFDNY